MASNCELQFYASSETQAQTTASHAINEVRRIERKFSRYRPDSIVSRINQAAGTTQVAVDEETAGLLDYANACHEISDGLFDITAGVLRRAWDFKKGIIPKPETIEPLLSLIDWRSVDWQKQTIALPKAGMEIDFGGIGKEYAADKAASVLCQHQIQYGFVNLGGDIAVFGPQANGKPWRIGVRHPRIANKIAFTVELDSGALATSGDYERYIEHNGKRYCHLMDPHTGLPVDYWQSISVVSPLCLSAGSAATIAMLKESEGIPFLKQQGFSFTAIDRNGEIISE